VNWKKTLLICVIIFLSAAAMLVFIYSTEPTAQRSSASKRTAMLVDVTAVEFGTFRPTITATGAVRPEQEISLRPRVSGEIIAISDSFTPGGFINAGETLLQIDPADYQAELLARQSALHQVSADLELELGRQELAKDDYSELEGSISSEYKALVLREPQLKTAQARVEAAQAAVQRAQLDLDRTRIRVPFAAHVLTREANVGSQVSPGDTLGQLVGTDYYWVEAAVPVSHVRWIELPGGSGSTASTASVSNRAAWPEGTYRTAQVHSLIGALESQTRLARVLLTIADPLSHEEASADLPPMMVGSFVEVKIEGKPIKNVVRLARDYLRQNDTVWVNAGGVLEIRTVTLEFLDNQFAYISDGLGAEDLVVTTNLASVFEGASLRLEGEDRAENEESVE
jgi:RND family efflux transporter MFP subunit